MTDEELIDAWQWVRDHFNDEMAQRVALRMLEKPPIPGTALVYAKFLLQCALRTERAPHFVRGADGKLRRIQRESPLSDGRLEAYPHDGNPETILLAQEAFMEIERATPERVKVVMVGTVRRAECHPDRKHYARGLCKACHQRQLYQADQAAINARRRAQYRITQAQQAP